MKSAVMKSQKGKSHLLYSLYSLHNTIQCTSDYGVGSSFFQSFEK